MARAPTPRPCRPRATISMRSAAWVPRSSVRRRRSVSHQGSRVRVSARGARDADCSAGAVSGDTHTRLSLAAFPGGFPRRLSLAASSGGFPWRLPLAASPGGFPWRLPLAASLGQGPTTSTCGKAFDPVLLRPLAACGGLGDGGRPGLCHPARAGLRGESCRPRRLTDDRTAKAVPCRSDVADGRTAGTETVDPLECLARVVDHIATRAPCPRGTSAGTPPPRVVLP